MTQSPPRLAFAFSLGNALLCREASLPYAILNAQIDQKTAAASHEAIALQKAMEIVGAQVADHLFSIVSTLPSDARRQTLALKRKIFAFDPAADLPIVERLAAELALDLPAFLTWVGHARELAALWIATESGYADRQAERADAAIRAAFAEADFRNGLALTSQGMLDRFADLDRGGKKARHARLKLLNFVVRSANKSALLNRLARAALVTSDGFRTTTPHDEVRPSVERLRAAFERMPLSLRRYRLHGNIRWDGNVSAFLGSRALRIGAARNYVERIIQLSPAEANVVRNLPVARDFSGTDLLEALSASGVPAAEAQALVTRLTASGLLVLQSPSGLAETNAALAVEVNALDRPDIAEAIAALSAPRTDDTQRLIQRSRDFDAKLNNGVEEGARPQVGNDTNSLYEMAWRPFPVPDATISAVCERLDGDFFEALAGYLRPAPLYATLLANFIHRFGSGGRCTDLESWLGSVVLEGKGGTSHLLRGATLTGAVALTLYVALLKDADGQAHLHLQVVHSRGGWQLPRFAFGDSVSSHKLKMILASDLSAFAAPSRAISLMADSDILNIQANPPLFDSQLLCENQATGAFQPIRISNLSLCHNELSNMLEFEIDGQRVRPIYGGGMVPAPQLGMPYMLALIADPFRFQPFMPPLDPPRERSIMRVLPRYVGKVLVSRGLRWVPREYFDKALQQSGFARFIEINRLWSEHGFPERCYVCGLSSISKSSFYAAASKASESQWFDVRIDRCIAYLKELEAYDWVILFDDSNALNHAIDEPGCSGKVMSFCLEAYLPSVTAPF